MTLQEKFNGISIWEIAEFWIETYPEDIFINKPKEVIEIRNQFKILLMYRKTNGFQTDSTPSEPPLDLPTSLQDRIIHKYETPDIFIKCVISLCKKFNLSIAHEDTQGAFIITDYSEENINWFKNAFDHTIQNKES